MIAGRADDTEGAKRAEYVGISETIRVFTLLGKVFFILLLFKSSAASAEALLLSPKIGVRTSAGILQNAGTGGAGSTFAIGGLDFCYLHFLTPTLALAPGYHLELNYGSGTTPLYGPNFGTRWYLKGQGTATKVSRESTSSERLDQFTYYLGANLSQRSFYTGSHVTAITDLVTGSYFGLGAIAGTDFTLSRHLQLNLEVIYGVLTFASSDDRIKLKEIQGQIGILYVW